MKYFVSTCFWIILIHLVASHKTLAQWSTNPNQNNPICTELHNQQTPAITTDGASGAIITWWDFRNDGGDIFAQRINRKGIVQWITDGVPVCTEPDSQNCPVIISDRTGGAIIAWQDNRSNLDWDIYAQKIDSNGIPQWTVNGIPICTAIGDQLALTITDDDSGGAIITWHDLRNGFPNYDIFAQRVNAAGVVQWTLNGVAVCTAINEQSAPRIISDESGGAIITWHDLRGADRDIYSQRIDAHGNLLWQTNGVPISTAADYQIMPQIVGDGKGGAIISWFDLRHTYPNYDVYAQRIDATGAIRWTVNGVEISTAPSRQVYTAIATDSSGGAIITWEDNRNITSWDIYAQRIDSLGNTKWTSNGVVVAESVGDTDINFPSIIADGSGGAIIAWPDYRSKMNYDIYAQRLNANGTNAWKQNGVSISTAPNDQYHPTGPVMTNIMTGGAIVAWEDSRSGTNIDVYAQLVSSNGDLGEKGLIAYYPFNGNANDESGFNRHATPSGAVLTLDRCGNYNRAYSFDGVDDFIRASGIGLPSAARTVSFWFKTNDMSGKPVMLAYGGSVCGTSWLEGFNLWPYSGFTIESHCNIKDFHVPYSSDLTGNWYHYVVTTDTSGSKMFLNAILIGDTSLFIDNTSTFQGDLSFGVGVFHDGKAPYADGTMRYFSGSLDDIRIYNYALSDSEILILYHENCFSEMHASSGWNMLSVPSFVSDYRKEFLFPSAVSYAFNYKGGYDIADTLRLGYGYWLKFDSSTYIAFGDSTCLRESVDVRVGWNMIGSISVPIGTTSITSDPPGIITSQFFSYNGIYRTYDSIWPGKGYWVKTNQNGKLILASISATMSSSRIKIVSTAEQPPFPPADQPSTHQYVPSEYILYQNHPNPFNPMTEIEFSVPISALVSLKVYDVLGREVTTLVHEQRDPGKYRVTWNADGIPSGVYFYSLQSNKFSNTKKLLILR